MILKWQSNLSRPMAECVERADWSPVWHPIDLGRFKLKPSYFGTSMMSRCGKDYLNAPPLSIWINQFFISLFELNKQSLKKLSSAVWPDWAIYWTLWNFSKPLAAINLPKSPTFLGNFFEGVKNYHFLVISFLGNFYRHLAIFFRSHWFSVKK